MGRYRSGIIVTAGLSLVLACTPEAQTTPVEKQSSELRWVPNLILNQKAPRIAVRKSEADGMKDLEKMVDEEKLEEAYAFFPKKGEWIEIGHESEERHGTETGVRVYWNFQVVDEYLRLNPDVDRAEFIHYHPRSQRKRIEDVAAAQLPAMGIEMNPQQHNTLARIITQLPSNSDVYEAIVKSIWVYERHPKVQSVFKVVSEAGTVTFQLTKEGVSHYASLSLDERKREAQIYARKLKESNHHIATRGALEGRNPLQEVEEACRLNQKSLLLSTGGREPTRVTQPYHIDYQFRKR